MTANSSSKNHLVMNRVKKDLEAVCPFAVGQNQPLSESITTDLTCFLISHEQVPRLFSKTCQDRELGRQPILCFSIGCTGKHFQWLIWIFLTAKLTHIPSTRSLCSCEPLQISPYRFQSMLLKLESELQEIPAPPNKAQPLISTTAQVSYT